MFTLKKIWNALNHAGKPWQIALAIALGMLVGFTPILSIHNIIVLFIVLIFNIHLTVFLLAISFFGTLGLILDPLFASIGKAVLTSSSLENLFTSWFNNPFGHLTYFNNTITMGSLLVSLVLLLLVYKISSLLLVKYRTVIAVKIKNIPILNKIAFFEKEQESEVKTFRIFGVVTIVAIVGFVSLFNIVFLDNIIKSNIETAFNKSSNKTIKIGDLTTSFFNSSVEVANIKINDNSDNIHIKQATLDIDLGQLIFKKVIIDNLKIDGISFPKNKSSNTNETLVDTSTKSTSDISNVKKDTSTNNLSALKDLNNIQIEKDFDKEVKNQFNKYKGFYEQIKPLFNTEKKSVKNRDDGKFIYYALESNLPDVLIKNGTFSIIKDELLINGDFQDFTTNQYIYKKPFMLNVDTKSDEIGSVFLNATFLETHSINQDTLNVKLNDFSVAKKEEKNFSINNTKINTEFDLKIENKNKIVGSQSIKVITTDISIPESNKYVGMLNKSLIKTKGIQGNVFISGTLNDPKIKVKSNADRILKKKIKEVLKSQENAIKDEVKTKVKEKVKSKLKKLLGF